MANLVQDTILQYWNLSRKTKSTPSGWISGNAPCCEHQGEKPDVHGRGGFMATLEGGITYHCFNCHYTTGWRPGRGLGLKFRKLLTWMGVTESDLNLLRFETLKFVQQASTEQVRETIEFEARSLPDQAKMFHELSTWYSLVSEGSDVTQTVPQDLVEVIDYVQSRSIDTTKYDLAWTPQTEMKLNKRVIIPFYYKSKILGYSARAIAADVKPKYLSNHPSNFVFNLDQQTPDKKFVIVCEGPMDAMSIDGVALCGSEINDTQAKLINGLNRRVIVVPDADQAGRKMITRCMDLGWEVSFPAWQITSKDINEAVNNYGKLFTLKAVIESSIKSKLKIQLKLKGLSD